MEGVSFASIKAGTKVPKVPPPPVAPGDRDFTTTELVQFDGSDPKKPLYMSILGRVYVTWWWDFADWVGTLVGMVVLHFYSFESIDLEMRNFDLYRWGILKRSPSRMDCGKDIVPQSSDFFRFPYVATIEWPNLMQGLQSTTGETEGNSTTNEKLGPTYELATHMPFIFVGVIGPMGVSQMHEAGQVKSSHVLLGDPSNSPLLSTFTW